MRTLAPTALLFITSALFAQVLESRSIAVEALSIAVSMTSLEMQDCARAHPQHAQRFTESANEAHSKLEAALESLHAERATDLDLTVPEIMVVGREMTSALMSTDKSRQTLEICSRTAAEIANVTDREATELMDQLVTTLVTGVSAHQQGMNRALR